MLNGYYENKTKFYFGRDTEINISNEIPRKSKVLLVYGRKSFRNIKGCKSKNI